MQSKSSAPNTILPGCWPIPLSRAASRKADSGQFLRRQGRPLIERHTWEDFSAQVFSSVLFDHLPDLGSQINGSLFDGQFRRLSLMMREPASSKATTASYSNRTARAAERAYISLISALLIATRSSAWVMACSNNSYPNTRCSIASRMHRSRRSGLRPPPKPAGNYAKGRQPQLGRAPIRMSNPGLRFASR